MKKLLGAFTSNVVFANIMILLMFLAGGISIFAMRREMFPTMELDLVSISVAYPGADPEEVEEGILRKIEDVLQGEEGIKEITSTASENVGSVLVTVEESADTQKVLDRVRSKVNGISTFPVDAENPVISDLLLVDPVVILAISGEMPEARMKEWAETVKEKLLQHPKITIVDIFGAREYEISIEVSEERLREHKLSLEQVTAAVRAHNQNVPGGLLRSEAQEIRLRTMGRKYRGEELAEIPVITRDDGSVLYLGELATIVDGFQEDALRPGVDGKPGLFLYVQKTSTQDALDISNATLKFVEEESKLLPEGLDLDVIYDTTDMLRARINLLVKNGGYGLLLVFILLWLFLDLRLSIWAGMGMPISIAGALVILWAVGGSLNMISLFGLIMVLGVIVDDAIVVGEAIYHHQQQPGANPFQAAVNGVAEVAMPVLGAVTTTILAFMPLMFIGGIMGKFIGILPVVVIACLVVSLVECLILLPAHLSESLPSKRDKKGKLQKLFNALHAQTGERLERFASGPYQNFLRVALRWRYVALALAVSVLIVTVGAIGGGRIGLSMFPKFDSFIETAFVEFPAGTPIDVTDEALDQLEQAALSLNEQLRTKDGGPVVQQTIRLAGQNLNDAYGPISPSHGSVQMLLVESSQRDLESDAIMNMWEEAIGTVPGAEALSIEGLSAGPPGKPVDVRLRGNDLEMLKAASTAMQAQIATYPGTSQIQSSYRPGKNEIRFSLKEEALSLGITVAELGRQLSFAYYGAEALRIQRGRDDIRIMIRNTEEERSRFATLEQVRIRAPDGRELPLMAVADMEIVPGFANITRVDGLRSVGVSSNVNKDKTPSSEIIADLEKNHFPRFREDFPGVLFDFQGEQKDSQESVASLQYGFPIALVGIFVIIATIFRSYIQPGIIMLTVPFGIIGAVVGHWMKGIDLSLMSLFGIVALSGVVVNDAIVLIEAFNTNIAKGMDVTDAILEAGKRRFRAVFLTTLSTVGGLMPLILETDLQAQFLIPMALSIAAGVAFATLLTLLLIPSLMLILNDFRMYMHFVIKGRRADTRAEVEPARHRNTLSSLS